LKEKLNNLFDVSHSNALNMVKIEEDKNFLLMEREKGKPDACWELIEIWQKKKTVPLSIYIKPNNVEKEQK
jgi:adenylate/nucleoside-diphosphate kinase